MICIFSIFQFTIFSIIYGSHTRSLLLSKYTVPKYHFRGLFWLIVSKYFLIESDV